MPSYPLSFIACGLYFLLTLFTFVPLAASSTIDPVIETNFADPCLTQDKLGKWHAFSTQNENIHIQHASSHDFHNWTLDEGYDALPVLPSWAVSHPRTNVWAPDVNQLPSGNGWVMFFAARHKAFPKRHCIGAATSLNVTGPYTPLKQTMVCNLYRGGNIDPSLFHDPKSGFYYLLYKVDGNTIGHGGACGNTNSPVAATPIYLQRVSATDLTTHIDLPVFLINNLDHDGFKHDGANTERPSMVFRNDTYYLLYNSHCYASLSYRVNYISCVNGIDTHTGLLGCQWSKLKAVQQKLNERTLLKTNMTVSNTKLYAPGSMDTSADSHKVVFHGDINLNWFHKKAGSKIKRVRAMYAATIEYEGGKEGDLAVVSLIPDS